MRLHLQALLLTLAALAEVIDAVDDFAERDILQEFFQATNGESWNSNDGWDDNTDDYCSWFGVVCQGEKDELDDRERLLMLSHNENGRRKLETIPVNAGGKVIALKLKNNNLQGRLPATFWNLPNIRYLTLSGNPLEVSFVGRSDTLVELKMHATKTTSVTGISNFPRLVSIHMSSSPLGRVQFPKELFKLTELQILHMAECQMEGTIPANIFDFDALQELNLYNNEFTGLLPAQLQVLSDLRLLNLSSNHLLGILPEWLGTKLPKLEELYLEYNMFTGPLLPFDGAINLKRLYLDGNELTGDIPADFLGGVLDQGTKIYVNLDNNQFTGLVPDSLDNLENLPLVLTLAGNQFTGFASEALCDNVKWMEGDVKSSGCDAILCPVKKVAPLGRHTGTSPCTKCDNGKYLGEMKCMEQDDRSTLQFLYSETGGDHWDRNDNWLDDTVSLCEWYGIHCYQSGEKHEGRVKSISLSNNGLVGIVSSHVYALDLAVHIDLSWNRIQFPFEDISLTQHLNILNVGHTDTDSLDGIETAHSFFKIFSADRLSIDGPIPSQIYQNTVMTILSLNNCGLSGKISTEIGKMTNLKELYLWGNDLTGSIPTEIGLLTNLSILTLAKNKLTGTLPATLEGLTALKAFTVKDQVSKGGGLTGDILPFQYNPILSNLILSGNKFSRSIPETMLSSVDTSKIPGTIIIDLSNNELTGSVPGTLAKFDQMDIHLQSNFLSSVNPLLCSKLDWMSGNVGEYGCDAILCPEFTSSPLGRQAFGNIACESCPNADTSKPSVGQTSCEAQPMALSEKEILTKLFDQCGGKTWSNNQNWLAAGNVCEWYGIACDDAESVVSIVLGANNILGTIPQEIFLLPNLERLAFFSNTVDLKFDGIASATNLKALILDDTKVISLAGLGMARGLTELNIRSNELKGTIPDEIAKLNNLVSLILSDNQLSGTIPLWLSNLNKLTSLMFNNNRFTGPMRAFEKFPDITLMSAAVNQLTGTIPDNLFASVEHDQKIFCDLSANMLTGTIPGALYHLNRLTLHVQDNKIQSVADELCRMDAWNDYDVENYGCSGLVCPIGTYNNKGRQTSADTPCQDCPQNKYYGSTKCSSGFAVGWSSLVLLGGFVVSMVLTW